MAAASRISGGDPIGSHISRLFIFSQEYICFEILKPQSLYHNPCTLLREGALISGVTPSALVTLMRYCTRGPASERATRGGKRRLASGARQQQEDADRGGEGGGGDGEDHHA